ncbi:hypothetical protein BDP81DRAFT_165260 [Colletotrichum phormii]|uniref:Uncharacterized protein n=1 Tax=Colletotrichum phormii TaxID=359342 RepID=A0AAI9ZZA4_9PEZI|nr:uncharacterized protein BDP81DRAFT_165260 [Colletotrichum phormii]KAK1640560.1 hypothetical protein BDP81DRAFT_165260 [Colletotrichum phormii]
MIAIIDNPSTPPPPIWGWRQAVSNSVCSDCCSWLIVVVVLQRPSPIPIPMPYRPIPTSPNRHPCVVFAEWPAHSTASPRRQARVGVILGCRIECPFGHPPTSPHTHTLTYPPQISQEMRIVIFQVVARDTFLIWERHTHRYVVPADEMEGPINGRRWMATR